MRLEEHPTVKKYLTQKQNLPAELPGHPIERDWLRNVAFEAGADDVGLVEIDRPELNDERGDILSVFPETKTLIGLVYRLNPENVRCVSRAVSDLEFMHAFHQTNHIARRIVTALNTKGIRALSPSCAFPMDMGRWPGKMWPISHKTIAVQAGMGAIGHHRLVIHPRFGSFVTLGTILVDQEADTYDCPLDYNPCLVCKLCASVCPVGAVAPDGHFNFAACITHNYRDRLGGFQNWVEQVASSGSVKEYRSRVKDSETVSMWQTLSYGICCKSSYCMAVCPAGEDMVGTFLEDRKGYMKKVVRPLQENTEAVYVVPGSDGESHLRKHFPHKIPRTVSNGLRSNSAIGFLNALPLVFQRNCSDGLDATYHFTFTGNENIQGTVIIKDKTIEVKKGHVVRCDLGIIADARTWIAFLAGEKNLVWALLQRKIKIKGSPKLMSAFGRCFPS